MINAVDDVRATHEFASSTVLRQVLSESSRSALTSAPDTVASKTLWKQSSSVVTAVTENPDANVRNARQLAKECLNIEQLVQ